MTRQAVVTQESRAWSEKRARPPTVGFEPKSNSSGMPTMHAPAEPVLDVGTEGPSDRLGPGYFNEQDQLWLRRRPATLPRTPTCAM